MTNINGIAQVARISVRCCWERFTKACRVPFGQSSHSSELTEFGFICWFFLGGKWVVEYPVFKSASARTQCTLSPLRWPSVCAIAHPWSERGKNSFIDSVGETVAKTQRFGDVGHRKRFIENEIKRLGGKSLRFFKTGLSASENCPESPSNSRSAVTHRRIP